MTALVNPVALRFPPKTAFLFRPSAFHAAWGGRGSAKSWTVARRLVMAAVTEKHRVLCTRQYQSSIRDSVHQTLVSQIVNDPPLGLGLSRYFEVTQSTIRSLTTGSEFIYKGLARDIMEIKSLEGITRTWVEEAVNVPETTWAILIPTVMRSPGAEMFITWNQLDERAPTQVRFAGEKKAPDCLTECLTFEDNPFFPKELDRVRLYDLENDPETYDHIWGDAFRSIGNQVIFAGKAVVEDFETPTDPEPRWLHGLDFGFAADPTFLTRGFIVDQNLYIDEEAVGYGVELLELPKLLGSVPTTLQGWPIKADGSRPETISYLAGEGFNITAAEKWPGSVEDGIAHLKGFRKIYIHPRCRNLAREARLYSYKVDVRTGDVLPIVVDKHNHGWDAARYSLDGYIQRRGGLETWKRLAAMA